MKKFDFCIGNPPYQGENHYQMYPDFYIGAKNVAECVEMIFPTAWQEPKNANNLGKMNSSDIKEDRQSNIQTKTESNIVNYKKTN